MRRILLTLLAAFILLTQWGLVAHAYQDHDDEQVCELCLAKSQHDHILLSSPPVLSFSNHFGLNETSPYRVFTTHAIRHFAVRAPPHSL